MYISGSLVKLSILIFTLIQYHCFDYENYFQKDEIIDTFKELQRKVQKVRQSYGNLSLETTADLDREVQHQPPIMPEDIL